MAFNDKKDKAKEPWKAQIYDTEPETSSSRLAQRKKKKGNTLFIHLLVILLIIIVSVPTLFYFLTVGKSGSSDVKVGKFSSTKAKSSVRSTSSITSSRKSSSATKSSQAIKSSTSDSEEDEETSVITSASSSAVTSSSSTTNAAYKYETVEEGEGLQQIAQRTGISVETLAKLNGITLNQDGSFSPAINPGQQLRIN